LEAHHRARQLGNSRFRHPDLYQYHPADLKAPGQTWLHLDLAQCGVGGDNSWGALPHDQYRLLAKQYSYSYTLRLVGGESPK
jgi:beta-galactosidase